MDPPWITIINEYGIKFLLDLGLIKALINALLMAVCLKHDLKQNEYDMTISIHLFHEHSSDLAVNSQW